MQVPALIMPDSRRRPEALVVRFCASSDRSILERAGMIRVFGLSAERPGTDARRSIGGGMATPGVRTIPGNAGERGIAGIEGLLDYGRDRDNLRLRAGPRIAAPNLAVANHLRRGGTLGSQSQAPRLCRPWRSSVTR